MMCVWISVEFNLSYLFVLPALTVLQATNRGQQIGGERGTEATAATGKLAA
jgi:hypothetical protein